MRLNDDVDTFETRTVRGVTGVYVDLSGGFGAGGDAEGDTLTSIENVVGSAYNDILNGDKNANSLYGGDGNDSLYGRLGNDSLLGEQGDDQLNGGDGHDGLYGGPGRDTLRGGEGNDTLFGNSGDDRLYGEAGDDSLEGGEGKDRMDGGDGTDTVSYSGSAELTGDDPSVNIKVRTNDDVDTFELRTVRGVTGVYVDLSGGFGAGGDAEGDTLTSIENVVGSDYKDVLNGDNHDNILSGGKGNDSLYGRNGDDSLFGEEGRDQLDGGNGDDDLKGGSGDDRLYGDEGDDYLYGGAGDDRLTGGEGEDVFIFEANSGADTIMDWKTAEDKIDLEELEKTPGQAITFGDIEQEYTAATDTLVITLLSDDNTITLTGTGSELGADSFIFGG